MEPSMTAQQFAEAFKFIVDEYTKSTQTEAHLTCAVDLAKSLFTSPHDFWDRYFEIPADDPMRLKAEDLMKKLGFNATFQDFRKLMEKEEASIRESIQRGQ